MDEKKVIEDIKPVSSSNLTSDDNKVEDNAVNIAKSSKNLTKNSKSKTKSNVLIITLAILMILILISLSIYAYFKK